MRAGWSAIVRPAPLLFLALVVGSSCGPAHHPGDYRLASVPDMTEVGPSACMAWFEANAVTSETVEFVESHSRALELTVEELTELVAAVDGVRVKTRRNVNDPGKPGLKEPSKVEEKIYRDLVKSKDRWDRYEAGESNRKGDFPKNATPAEARRMVFGAAPEHPVAIRDVAGVRLIGPDLAKVRTVEGAVRKRYGKDIIRFKDFLGEHYRGDGYRSVHFVIVQDKKPVEIQVRTEAQNRWARWEHRLVYKGRFKNNGTVRDYARTVAEVLHQRETDNCPPPCKLPECPDILQQAKRCFTE